MNFVSAVTSKEYVNDYEADYLGSISIIGGTSLEVLEDGDSGYVNLEPKKLGWLDHRIDIEFEFATARDADTIYFTIDRHWTTQSVDVYLVGKYSNGVEYLEYCGSYTDGSHSYDDTDDSYLIYGVIFDINAISSFNMDVETLYMTY